MPTPLQASFLAVSCLPPCLPPCLSALSTCNPTSFPTLLPARPHAHPACPQASDCPHLANERIRRLNLLRGKNVVKNLLVEVGQAAAAQGQQAQQQQGPTNGG